MSRLRMATGLVVRVVVAAAWLSAILACGAVVASRFLLTPERIEAHLLPPLEAALGRDIHVGSARLDLRGLSLHDVAISEDPRFAYTAGESFLTAQRVRLGVDANALLDRRLLIRQIVLERPVIRLSRDERGSWNLSSLASFAAQSPSVTAAPTRRGALDAGRPASGLIPGGLSLQVDEIRVEHGTLRLRTERTDGAPLELQGLAVEGQTRFTPAGRIQASISTRLLLDEARPTWVTIDADLDRAGKAGNLEIAADVVRFRDLRLSRITGDLRIGDGKLQARAMEADLAGGRARLRGRLDTAAERLAYDGRLELERVDLRALTEGLVPELAGRMAGRGNLTLDFSASGRTRKELLASLGVGADATVATGHARADVTLHLEHIDVAAVLARVTARDEAQDEEDGEVDRGGLGPYDTGVIGAELTVTADHAAFDQYALQGVAGRLELDDGRLLVPELSATAAGGSLALEGTVDLDEPGLAYAGSIALEHAKLATLTLPLPRPPWGEHTGLVDLAFSFSGRGTTVQTALPWLDAGGMVTIASGWVRDSRLFSDIGDATGIEGFDALYIEDGGGRLSIAGGRVSSERVIIGNDDARLLAAGSIGFDGTLDVELWIGLGPDRQRKLLSRGILLPYIKDSSGWTNVPVLIEGSTSDVDVTLVKEAYAETAVRAVPATALRIISEGRDATTKVVKGSVASLKLLLGGLGKVVSGDDDVSANPD